MPLAVYALTAGAFGIGVTEFVIMGLLLQVGADLGVGVPTAGLLITGYALGVCVGAPIITLATRRWPRKAVLLALMGVFTLGNLACALAPTYGALMAARVLTSLAHGSFFGVGSVVATRLVAPERRASAISVMFTGLTLATILGVPFGAWIGLHYGWRSTFWAVAGVGLAATAVIALFTPGDAQASGAREPEVGFGEELAAVRRPEVLLALAMTVLGFAGLFTVFTYVQPLLTQVSGFREAAVSPILLVFGGGLAVGNLLGGRLADRSLARALIGTLAVLALTLAVMGFVLGSQPLTVAFCALLGAAAFATVAPLQLHVLETAGPAGRNLASSLNIAAFNLGNALGAWLGGRVIAEGPGLAALPWTAAGVTLAGLVVAGLGLSQARRAAARCTA